MPLTSETVRKLVVPGDEKERKLLAARLILEYEHAQSSINDLCWRVGTKICLGTAPAELVRGYTKQRTGEVKEYTELLEAISDKLGEFGLGFSVDRDCYDTVGARVEAATAQFMKQYSTSELWKLKIGE